MVNETTRPLHPFALALVAAIHHSPVIGAELDKPFNIPSQPLSSALNQYADSADVQLSYPAVLVTGITSQGVSGRYSSSMALQKLLSGTGFVARTTENGTITLVKNEGVEPQVKQKSTAVTSSNSTTLAPISVTANAESEVYEPEDPYNPDYNRTNAQTATKTDTPIMQTPMSIHVVPSAILADKQSISLPDTVNGHVSGVLGRTGGGYLYDNFIIRGLSGSGFGDAYRNGLFNRQDIYDTSNIERVEILKGPAAVLYGRIEPGGMVNYVTKKPLDTPYYALQQQFGSYEQYRSVIDATGPIDKNKTLLYRLNGSFTDNGSFRDFVGNQRFFVAPSFSWRPTEKFETNLQLEYKHDRLNADQGLPAINGQIANIPITRNLKDGPERQTMESTLVGFDWTYRFNDNWKVTQRYLFKDWTLGGPTLYNYLGFKDDNRTLNRLPSKGDQDVMTHSGNIDLNGKFDLLGTKHNFLLGVDGFRATTEAQDAEGGIAPIDIYNPVYGQVNFDALTVENSFFHRKEWWMGVYIQDQITFFNKLHLLLGGRYDNVTTGANFTAESFEAAKAGRVAYSDDAFSPRIGLTYQVQNWLSVYGNYTESFSSNNGLSASGTNFRPQRGKQYEIGVKTESQDKRLSSTLAFFDITKSNLLTDDPNEANPNFQILAGKVKSKGIELDLAGQITQQLHLLATYAYTQVSYTEDFSGYKGNRLENVPRHQGSLWSTWNVSDAFKFGLGVVVAGKRPGDNENTFTIPGYARMDAMAAYTHRIGKHRLTAQFNINNVLDKDYYVNTDGGSRGVIPGMPLNFMGSLKYEF